MYKQRLPIIGFIALVSTMTLPSQVTAGTGLTVLTINSTRAYPERITYRATSEGLEVAGTVRSRRHNGPIRGHVDVVFTDAKGETLAVRSAKLMKNRHASKHQHHVHFKTAFDELPASATYMQVSHHVGTKGH